MISVKDLHLHVRDRNNKFFSHGYSILTIRKREVYFDHHDAAKTARGEPWIQGGHCLESRRQTGWISGITSNMPTALICWCIIISWSNIDYLVGFDFIFQMHSCMHNLCIFSLAKSTSLLSCSSRNFNVWTSSWRNSKRIYGRCRSICQRPQTLKRQRFVQDWNSTTWEKNAIPSNIYIYIEY